MPALYHQVSPKVWDRQMRSASRSAQALAFYVLTSPHRNTEGLYALPLGYIAHDTGMLEDEVLQAFVELERLGVASYDPEAEAVLDRWALRTQPITSSRDNRLKNAVPRALEVSSTRLRRELYLLAVEYSPPLAEHLGLAEPSLTHQAPREAPSKPLVRGSAGASEGREELSREEVEGEAGVAATPPPCAWCDPWGEVRPAQPDGDGHLSYEDQPWCGVCEPTALAAS